MNINIRVSCFHYTQTITHQLCTHRQSHINYVHTDNHTSTVLHSWKDLKDKSSHLTFKQSWHFTHCGDHLHDCIISLRGEVWANKTSLTCHFFFLLKCVYQCRKVSGHVCQEYRSCFCPQFFNWVLELFHQCDIVSVIC